MAKTQIIYEENYDPTKREITHVAIQSGGKTPYVYCTYSVKEDSKLPSSRDIPILPIKFARDLFEFVPGKLEVTLKTL